MKVVFDSNIYVSNLHFGGAISKMFDAIKERKITVCVSEEVVKEVIQTLANKFKWNKDNLLEAEKLVSTVGEYITTTPTVSVVKSDPTDNKILACAQAANADYIVTGDKKHLLPLKKFKGIPILSPRDFLSQVLYKLP
ncbi:putative toxin-antitoxin system toxin component, PIN family [Candidatus Amesbacteria bacterium RIFCSPHIGHO2_01_FULL_48_32]|uniref:Putative toxin-antitoxin system toxin component, PIN family n=1 Tax=Candidatus Amesbacteria bacterium RIFCSPLOWO2_01_FULL_48_25 TaxID=1797259 RepID=A0A1F4ZAV9_9BACT|nr:MAG: putative toxin-antitoxin system toxin component, PIN family [Candidatus Amesbacteria bacterium RIFCSPHIGHO2_01_FULL_48_32]OGD03362.1 MAG: putative toxin-antitoxin system toxin component, PIN family [Candidatus Amesbacteria bacterium RIFCSPLOWO2_01_FULL_48_25]HJZ05315.1 putative toxin-antitoxin system toxin component, PIN family [Patescibacteria group bacterium]